MRIAFVSDAIYPYNKGGKETRIFELTTRLAKSGHDIHVYTMKWWDTDEKSRIENGVTLHAISPKYPLYHGERRSIKEGILFGISCLKKLVTAKFDVVDVDHMPYFPLFFMKIVCVIKNKPLIATWHEVWGRDYWHEYLGRLGFIASMMERLSVYLPDHIVAVSPHTAKRLNTILHAGGPVSQAVNGFDMRAIVDIKPSKETSDIIYVGRLLAHKNVDQLIKAVAILKETKPDIKAMIISDGPMRASLEKLSSKLGVTENVVFKGFVKTDTDKLRMLKASRVFVLPSTREGFGIVALEAMACGLPVVTVNHPDNATTSLITPYSGRICPPNDPASLAAAIEDLLSEDAESDPASVAVTYDWNKSAQRMAEVYAK